MKGVHYDHAFLFILLLQFNDMATLEYSFTWIKNSKAID